ncbi:MAG TPA: hypothetical protein EYH35_00795 [Thiotrichaceae bacterium]|nr:hypothetical protein [Thiotrichaceae bacterium]
MKLKSVITVILCMVLSSCSSYKIIPQSEKTHTAVPNPSEKVDPCSTSIKNESDKTARLRYVELAADSEVKLIISDLKIRSMSQEKEKQYILNQCNIFAENLKNNTATTYQCAFTKCRTKASLIHQSMKH